MAIMGKPHKSVGWFKAVKKAFRSPSKEKTDNKDDTAKVMHSFLVKESNFNMCMSSMVLPQVF